MLCGAAIKELSFDVGFWSHIGAENDFSTFGIFFSSIASHVFWQVIQIVSAFANFSILRRLFLSTLHLGSENSFSYFL